MEAQRENGWQEFKSRIVRRGRAQWGKAFGRSLMASMVLVVGLAGSAQAAPAANPAVTESVAPTTAPAAAAPESITPVNPAPTIQPPETRGMDLSVWGMYQHADAVVKAVMIGWCWPRS